MVQVQKGQKLKVNKLILLEKTLSAALRSLKYLSFYLTLLATPTLADEPAVQQTPPDATPEKEIPANTSASGEKGLTQELIEENREISARIRGWATDLDLYLAKGEYADDLNKTTVTIYNGVSFREQGERSYGLRFGAKLHLPNLQKKWRLLVTNYDQDREDRGINKNRYQSRTQEDSYATSIAVFQQLGKVAVEFRPLLEYRKELYTSYLLIFSSKGEIGILTIKPELQLFARSDTGTGEFLGINFTFYINESNDLTVINEEQYTDGDNLFSTNHGLRWDHAYNKKMSQQSSLIFESNKREVYRLEQYVFNTTFEHKLYPNVLHYEITPLLFMTRAEDFQPRAGLDLVLKIIF